MSVKGKYRWFVVAVFFVFMLLHQADKLLIGPLTTPIMEYFNINEAQMGVVFSGALFVGGIFYPLWGYLYDRYARSKLLSLASFIWGATTWLSAVAKTFPVFVITRASTGIDDASYPGLYSLISDYFPPKERGRIYGLLQIAMPLGYIIGTILAITLAARWHWQGVFYLTGSLGIVLAIIIFFSVKEMPRGGAEPEFEGLEEISTYRFDLKTALELFKKRSLQFLFLQGFFGSFPWQVITFWFFRYLETERGFNSTEIMITMVAAVLFLAAGYPIGGALGDYLFKKTHRGRVIVSAFGVITGAILLWITINLPTENRTLFTVMMCFTAIFIPFASPNVLSTVYDVTLPEVRSTANSVQNMIEQAGSAVAPAIAGLIAVNSSLRNAILIICIGAWLLCFFFFLFTIYFLPKDIQALRSELSNRAEQERMRQIVENPA